MKRLSFVLLLPLLCVSFAHAQQSPCPLAGTNFERIPEQPGVPGSGACIYYRAVPHKGYQRSYKLLVPDSIKTSPKADRLVVDFHGYGSSKSNQLEASCWKDKAIAGGFAVAYPNGTGFPVSYSAGDYCCDASPVRPPRDDVMFAKQVVADAKSLLSTPTSHWKAYASGLSNGGALAHEIGCAGTDVFAGIAAVSQTFTRKPGHACLDGRAPIPVLDVRAKHDDVIPYAGGPSLATFYTGVWLSADESRARWAEELQCSAAAPQRKDYAGGSYCLRMTCPTPFVQCTIEGKHVLYDTAREHGIDVCDAAWEFFGEQPQKLLP
ncbi:MAG TPA: hypothetical protein VI299_24340 [Polyangiales bacterium]